MPARAESRYRLLDAGIAIISAIAGSARPAAAHDLFAWLRGLSFVEQGPHGLYPHHLARDVLDADLRWRDPGGHADLVKRLTELQRAGVVLKLDDGTYRLTDAGADLAGVIESLRAWGDRWLDATSIK